MIILFQKGKSSRFNGIDKSLLTINGKTLRECIQEPCRVPVEAGDHILESFYLSRGHWSGKVTIAFGDTYYYNLKGLCNWSGFHGRRGGNPVSGKDHGEIYAFTFHPEEYRKIIFWLKICNFFLKRRPKEAKLWTLYAAMELKGLFILYQCIRWILPRKQQKGSISLVKGGNFHEIGEYITEDFDTIQDYAFYMGAVPGVTHDFYSGPDRVTGFSAPLPLQ